VGCLVTDGGGRCQPVGIGNGEEDEQSTQFGTDLDDGGLAGDAAELIIEDGLSDDVEGRGAELRLQVDLPADVRRQVMHQPRPHRAVPGGGRNGGGAYSGGRSSTAVR